MKSTSSHPISLRSILILSYYLWSKSCDGSPLFCFSDQNSVCISYPSHACYMLRVSCLPCFNEYTLLRPYRQDGCTRRALIKNTNEIRIVMLRWQPCLAKQASYIHPVSDGRFPSPRKRSL